MNPASAVTPPVVEPVPEAPPQAPPATKSAPAAPALAASAEKQAAPLLDLPPPQDRQAEMSVLGAMLLDAAAAARCAQLLRVEDFADPAHRILFGFLAESREPDEQADLTILEASLREAGLLETIGGRDYLLDLTESIPIIGNAAIYCGIIRRAAAQREAIQAALELARQAGQPRADVPALLQALTKRMQRVVEPRDTIGKRLTAAELLRTYPAQREAVIDGLLRKGEVANLVSSSKGFKSWFIMQLGLSVALDRPFLGFPTKRGRVLLLDYELAGGALAKRLDLVARAMNTTIEELGDHFIVHPLRGKRLDVNGLAGYFATIPPRYFDLILVDPLYRLFAPGMDENDNAAFAALYGTLQHYAEILDSGLIVVHHLSKGDQSYKALIDLGSGGGSQSRAADAHLAIRLHAQDDAAVLAGVVRNFPPFDAFCIKRIFPLWVLAPDLNPDDLRRQQTRPPRTRPPVVPVEPAPPPWTIERFTDEVLTEEPQTRAAVLNAATEAGVSTRLTEKLLAAAEAACKAFRWRLPKDNRLFYARTPQPTLSEETP
jgi:hypothetical protein